MVADLSDPKRREAARQELLLAKERAVAPLLEGLESSGGAARLAMVEVAAGLMSRVDDPRLPAVLGALLRQDPNPQIRAHIAHFAAVHRRAELVDPLLDALDDDDGEVRYEALLALAAMESKLDDDDASRLDERRSGLLHDPHPGVRLEGLIRAEGRVAEGLRAAERAVLEARLADAESIYAATVAQFPFSRQARYRQARYYYDKGQREHGLRLLRAGGMLLDVPHLPAAPVIDGRLDDPAWQTAARADSLFQFSFRHTAALPTANPATFRLGYTDEALFIAFRGEDDHPDSLVANVTEAMQADYVPGQSLEQSIWRDDIIELFFDADFDHSDYAHLGINSLGVCVEEWIRGSQQEMLSRGGRPQDWSNANWHADDEVAARVGKDHWIVEYRLNFGSEQFPRPSAADVWGFNLVRVYRGEEYSQWVRTIGAGHSPNDFGVLLFQ